MEWLIVIILLLGILTLFGWKGIEIIGKLLGLIGAFLILLIAWIGLRLIFGQDFVDFLIVSSVVLFAVAFIYGLIKADQEKNKEKENQSNQ